MNPDETKRRRYGPLPIPAVERRTHTVSVRLNVAELARLDSLRDTVQMQRGEYLRAAALHRLPPTIPVINREAWAKLARSAANLNQIARHLNEVGASGFVNEVRAAVDMFRGDLLGVKFDTKVGGEEDESQG